MHTPTHTQFDDHDRLVADGEAFTVQWPSISREFEHITRSLATNALASPLLRQDFVKNIPNFDAMTHDQQVTAAEEYLKAKGETTLAPPQENKGTPSARVSIYESAEAAAVLDPKVTAIIGEFHRNTEVVVNAL